MPSKIFPRYLSDHFYQLKVLLNVVGTAGEGAFLILFLGFDFGNYRGEYLIVNVFLFWECASLIFLWYYT